MVWPTTHQNGPLHTNPRATPHQPTGTAVIYTAALADPKVLEPLLGNVRKRCDACGGKSTISIADNFTIVQARCEPCDGTGFQSTPRTLDPKLYALAPQGARMFVVLDLAPTEHGGIVLPESAAEREVMGTGVVMACGPAVGIGGAPHPHGVRCDNPDELLYKRVLFGMWSYKTLRVSILDSEWESEIAVMTDRDVWAVDNSSL